jgi:hypothetical protein
VPKVLVMKRPKQEGRRGPGGDPTLSSGWPRQDIDVTVALVAAGKEIRK